VVRAALLALVLLLIGLAVEPPPAVAVWAPPPVVDSDDTAADAQFARATQRTTVAAIAPRSAAIVGVTAPREPTRAVLAGPAQRRSPRPPPGVA
jgi:hypothetical protein